jgi:hypothetical protein
MPQTEVFITLGFSLGIPAVGWWGDPSFMPQTESVDPQVKTWGYK